ncbi:XRE family transcriptional regulator [Bifidobacterium rousetti]|uniref:helix-turn-helix transcriptional regulator n=1 Tax=Bifidobacterium rousetti TaxID=2045439 RepID=UPI00123BAF17|nr:helix-turn-helix transcriptional regulator [Bifidobacterium rousetti]KAA8820438.1 XRE family transcriptional regulator [Bifidobacterium rousetti]
MTVPEIERRWIGKFQENLSIIRKVAGWTTQELADELGVARQTVSNLETGKTPMSKLQYLALRTVFNAEIAKEENRDLARVIKTLVDDPLASADTRPPADHDRASLSTAMQVLTIITGALASGAAAGALAFLMFPDAGSGRR